MQHRTVHETLPRRKLEIEKRLHAFRAGQRQKPLRVMARCRKLKCQEWATKTLHTDPLRGFGQADAFAVELKCVAVGQLIAALDGVANALD